ncbi:MAG: copper amine oxidase N-terminal domain-containing protein [Armatimonadetes bacterium]|nr:copper amine oxidase N-terminal domain-containing protein [Armatimonadota bacterium]
MRLSVTRGYIIGSIICLLAGAVAVAVWGADELVRVLVDGRERTFSPAARVRDGVTYAPLRAATEAVGAKVEWNQKAQLAVVCAGNQCVPIKRSQGIIVDGSLLIPLRLMAQALKCDVKWHAPTRTVAIWTKQGDPRKKTGFTPPCEDACELPSTR